MRIPVAVVAASLVLVAGGLSGCSPVVRPVLGVTTRDGVPTALVYGCGGDHTSVGVTGIPAVIPEQAGPKVRYWGIATADHVDGVQEITLLAPPPVGWRVQEIDPEARAGSLVRWVPADRYEIHATDAYELSLEGRDLASAPAGDVLVATGYGTRSVMTREAFETQARESC